MTTDQTYVPQGISNLAQVRKARARNRALAFGICVVLPTLLTAIYTGLIASREYTSVAEVAVDSEAGGPPGPNRPVPGTDIGRDTLIIQEFVLSRDLVNELVAHHHFAEHFGSPNVDRFSRLPPGASREKMHAYYLEHVTVDFDTDTSFLKLHVRAYSGQYANELASAILSIAEAKLRTLTDGMRSERTRDARALVSEAEARLVAAQSASIAEERAATPDRARLDRLQAERDVAMQGFRSAGAALEQARLDAVSNRQHFLRIAGPSRPDRASGPKAWRDVLTVAFASLALLIIATILIATAREHADV